MKKIEVKDYTGKCLSCKTKDYKTGEVFVSGEEVWVDFSCKRCGAVWYEVYKLDRVIVQEESDQGCM